jgi:hypothetical protein
MSAMGEELLGVGIPGRPAGVRPQRRRWVRSAFPARVRTALETYTGRAEAVIPLEQPVLDPC